MQTSTMFRPIGDTRYLPSMMEGFVNYTLTEKDPIQRVSRNIQASLWGLTLWGPTVSAHRFCVRQNTLLALGVDSGVDSGVR
jgi:hypothetical protein